MSKLRNSQASALQREVSCLFCWRQLLREAAQLPACWLQKTNQVADWNRAPFFTQTHTDFRPQGDVTKKHVIMCMCVTNNHLLASHIVVLEYPGAGHSSCLEGCGVKQERGTTKLRRPHPRYTQNTTVEEHGSSQGPCVPAEFETRAKASELYCVRNFSCVGWQVGTWFNLLITVWGGGQEKKKRDDEEENLCTTNRRPRPKQQ